MPPMWPLQWIRKEPRSCIPPYHAFKMQHLRLAIQLGHGILYVPWHILLTNIRVESWTRLRGHEIRSIFVEVIRYLDGRFGKTDPILIERISHELEESHGDYFYFSLWHSVGAVVADHLIAV